jgi:hypothetical protein
MKPMTLRLAFRTKSVISTMIAVQGKQIVILEKLDNLTAKNAMPALLKTFIEAGIALNPLTQRVKEGKSAKKTKTK